MNIFLELISVIFPEYCLSCGASGSVLCYKCGTTLPSGYSPDGKIIVALDYGDKRVKRAVWLLKYRNKRPLAKIFAERLYEILLEELSELALTKNFIRPLIVPMPISGKRFRRRGYNQAELIAEELLILLGKNSAELNKNALKKSRHTESQVITKNRRERLENLRDSFIADENIVRGKNIILLDDVITTGATMSEARRALKDAGAKNILCVAVAH